MRPRSEFHLVSLVLTSSRGQQRSPTFPKPSSPATMTGRRMCVTESWSWNIKTDQDQVISLLQRFHPESRTFLDESEAEGLQLQ